MEPKYYIVNGKKMSVPEAAREYGINKQTLKSRMFSRGISLEEALFSYKSHRPTLTKGDRFGHLLVLKKIKGKRNAKYLCKCDCGNEVVRLGLVLKKKTKSPKACCKIGCKYSKSERVPQRSQYSRPLGYDNWQGMKQRCYNPKNPSYPYYGGIGITVCEEFKRSFHAFMAELGPRPSDEYSVDRIDVTKGYIKGNIRWATKKEQAMNTRKVNELTLRIKELERKLEKMAR